MIPLPVLQRFSRNFIRRSTKEDFAEAFAADPRRIMGLLCERLHNYIPDQYGKKVLTFPGELQGTLVDREGNCTEVTWDQVREVFEGATNTCHLFLSADGDVFSFQCRLPNKTERYYGRR